MTGSDLLERILERIKSTDPRGLVFSADETAQWPAGALESLTEAGVLALAEPARVIECPGCERNCFMQVEVLPTVGKQASRVFIACDKPEDLGRVPVDPHRLKQWRTSAGLLAGALGRLLGFSSLPQVDDTGTRWVLGLLKGQGCAGEVTLLIEGGVTLAVAGHSISLAHMLTAAEHGLQIDRDALLTLLAGETRQPTSGVGSAQWRKQRAKAAADARHDHPGGSRDKRSQIRRLWATGNYRSRDACAEQECTALGMSYSAARKALQGTPEPT